MTTNNFILPKLDPAFHTVMSASNLSEHQTYIALSTLIAEYDKEVKHYKEKLARLTRFTDQLVEDADYPDLTIEYLEIKNL